MLIVLPTCVKDWTLALTNLQHALRLEEGQKTGFTCLVVIEPHKDLNQEPILKAANDLFAKVILQTVDVFKGSNKSWPHPQNHMWQRTARGIERNMPDERWFWWEPDCVPLQKGWMTKLESIVQGQPRPVVGAEAWQETTGHYLAGCAVYPGRCSRLFRQALLATDRAWDIVSQQEDGVLNSTHNISHAIKHTTDPEGVHFESMEDVKRLTTSETLLFHKCKDGSLAAVLAGRKPEAESPGLKPHPSVHVQAVQHGWESGVFAFPYEKDVVHFNPSIIRRGDDLLLITRRSRSIEGGSHSDLTIRKVRESNMTVETPFVVPAVPSKSSKEQWEDPKVFLCNDDAIGIYCANWTHNDGKAIKQACLKLNSDMTKGEIACQLPHPDATRHEKNWAPFMFEKSLHHVYSINPHIIDAPGVAYSRYGNPPLTLAWEYGELRGGTPPVRVGSEFISFFHSSVPWRRPKRRYYMGAYAFLAQPPFPITRVTTEPLLVGSEEDPRVLGGPLVVFPNGAVLCGPEQSAGELEIVIDCRCWTVVFGLNDEACGWVRIPMSELEERLVPVELHGDVKPSE